MRGEGKGEGKGFGYDDIELFIIMTRRTYIKEIDYLDIKLIIDYYHINN